MEIFLPLMKPQKESKISISEMIELTSPNMKSSVKQKLRGINECKELLLIAQEIYRNHLDDANLGNKVSP